MMLHSFGVDALGITKNISLGLYYGRADHNLQWDASSASAAGFTCLPTVGILLVVPYQHPQAH